MSGFPKLEGDALASIIEYHRAVTSQSFDPSGEPALSDKARNAVRLLNTGAFNCHTRQTALLLDIILGEAVSRAVNGTEAQRYLQGAIITATTHSSGCTLGRSYMIATVNKDHSIRAMSADNVPTGAIHANNYRRATDDEIVAFITERHGGPAQALPTEPAEMPF